MKSLIRGLRLLLAILVGLFCSACIIGFLCRPPNLNETGDEFLDAIESGNVERVTQMLDAGESATNRRLYDTPLTYAAYAGRTVVAELLIARGADVNQPGSPDHLMTPLLCAVHNRHVETARALLAHGADMTSATDYGWTPLSMATHKGPPEMVQLLLDRGADVHHKDDRGWQPLHIALRANRLSDDERRAIVEQLLAAHADPNALNPGGWQEDSNHDSSLGFGWNKNNPNEGNTPLAIAISNGFGDISKLLKNHGATKIDK